MRARTPAVRLPVTGSSRARAEVRLVGSTGATGVVSGSGRAEARSAAEESADATKGMMRDCTAVSRDETSEARFSKDAGGDVEEVLRPSEVERL